MGRRDSQIKLRGYRIDLRQIEQAIEARMPDLRVVASVVDAGTPSARLVAWMTGAQLPDHADATAAVAQVLPAHMRPILVMVDGFPRTAGGKIDKAALPVPEVAVHPAPVLDGDDTLVRDVSAIMANLLGSPDVGADQSFYDLEGIPF